MAIERLSVKVGKVGHAEAHAAYVTRTGEYSKLASKAGEIVEAVEHGNLPSWAQAEPLVFWKSADQYERKNGSTYREFEIALPRELTREQRIDLVKTFVWQELGEHHAYTFGIHNPAARDMQDQPHVHLMFCERKADGIERDPGQYFKRYNGKHPEKGGAKKTYGDVAELAGVSTTARLKARAADRAEELRALRGRWETACNAALAAAGRPERIDMRSYEARGIEIPAAPRLPGAKFRNPEAREAVYADREERAAARADLAGTRAAVARIDLARALKNIELSAGTHAGTQENTNGNDQTPAAELYFSHAPGHRPPAGAGVGLRNLSERTVARLREGGRQAPPFPVLPDHVRGDRLPHPEMRREPAAAPGLKPETAPHQAAQPLSALEQWRLNRATLASAQNNPPPAQAQPDQEQIDDEEDYYSPGM